VPYGQLRNQVGFEMQAVVTNLTPAYDVRVVEAELRGVKGSAGWNAVTSFLPGKGGVAGAILPPDIPIDVSVNIVLDRPPLSPGPHTARVILRDHLGQTHRSPKVTFNDVRKYASPSTAVDHGGDG